MFCCNNHHYEIMLVGNNCTGFIIFHFFSGRNNCSNRVIDSHGDGECVSTKEEFKTILAALVIQKSEFVHNCLDCILIIMYSCQMI